MVKDGRTAGIVIGLGLVGFGIYSLIKGKQPPEVPPPEVQPGLGGVSGWVTNADTGKAIPSVSVTLNGYSAYTGSSGYFQLLDVEPGSYILTLGKEGYMMFEQVRLIEEGMRDLGTLVLQPISPIVKLIYISDLRVESGLMELDPAIWGWDIYGVQKKQLRVHFWEVDVKNTGNTVGTFHYKTWYRYHGPSWGDFPGGWSPWVDYGYGVGSGSFTLEAGQTTTIEWWTERALIGVDMMGTRLETEAGVIIGEVAIPYYAY